MSYKLCAADAERIREAVHFGASRNDLMQVYNISRSTLNTCLRRASFQAPPDPTFQLLQRFCLAARVTA